MAYAQAFVFCEGSDDRQFVDRVVTPHLMAHFDQVKVVTYAQQKKEKTQAYVRNALKMSATVFLLADFDAASSVSDRVAAVRNRVGGLPEASDVFIVVQEIESWYLAGIPRDHDIPGLGQPPSRTDDVTKEEFNALLAENVSRLNVMAEILTRFDVARGRSKNHSLEYFCANVFDALSP